MTKREDSKLSKSMRGNISMANSAMQSSMIQTCDRDHSYWRLSDQLPCVFTGLY